MSELPQDPDRPSPYPSGDGSRRALVALSGGVDSSVTALLMQRAGYDVVGVFMRNGVSTHSAAEKSCCSASDARDAEAIAAKLDIPFYAVDYADEFGALIDWFADEYRRGRTPNPCVLCNQHLKFGHLFSLADGVGAEVVATGHYARMVDGAMYRSVDQQKDQTYYLFGVDRAALSRVRFPLGDLTKDEVRALAKDAGLRTAGKAESMEICFVTSGDYRDVVRARGGSGRPGRFLDATGKEVGTHDGIDGYTVGQRRGLPALGTPQYVRAIDPISGDVLLGPADGLLAGSAVVEGVRWLVDPPDEDAEFDALVQVRARSAAVPARLRIGALAAAGATGGEVAAGMVAAETTAVDVTFASDVRAITPGQAAVFYDGDRVLGGGWIG